MASTRGFVKLEADNSLLGGIGSVSSFNALENIFVIIIGGEDNELYIWPKLFGFINHLYFTSLSLQIALISL